MRYYNGLHDHAYALVHPSVLETKRLLHGPVIHTI